MTRKDYEKAAEIVSRAKTYAFTEQCRAIDVVGFFENELANLFIADNAKFDRKRFTEACKNKK